VKTINQTKKHNKNKKQKTTNFVARALCALVAITIITPIDAQAMLQKHINEHGKKRKARKEKSRLHQKTKRQKKPRVGFTPKNLETLAANRTLVAQDESTITFTKKELAYFILSPVIKETLCLNTEIRKKSKESTVLVSQPTKDSGQTILSLDDDKSDITQNPYFISLVCTFIEQLNKNKYFYCEAELIAFKTVIAFMYTHNCTTEALPANVAPRLIALNIPAQLQPQNIYHLVCSQGSVAHYLDLPKSFETILIVMLIKQNLQIPDFNFEEWFLKLPESRSSNDIRIHVLLDARKQAQAVAERKRSNPKSKPSLVKIGKKDYFQMLVDEMRGKYTFRVNYLRLEVGCLKLRGKYPKLAKTQ